MMIVTRQIVFFVFIFFPQLTTFSSLFSPFMTSIHFIKCLKTRKRGNCSKANKVSIIPSYRFVIDSMMRLPPVGLSSETRRRFCRRKLCLKPKKIRSCRRQIAEDEISFKQRERKCSHQWTAWFHSLTNSTALTSGSIANFNSLERTNNFCDFRCVKSWIEGSADFPSLIT